MTQSGFSIEMIRPWFYKKVLKRGTEVWPLKSVCKS